MSETCSPDAQRRARRAARDLRQLECVEDVELLPPDEEISRCWSLDIVIWSDSGDVPWQVADALGEYRLDHQADPQGAMVQVLAHA